MSGQRWLKRRNDSALNRTDVRDDRALLKGWRNDASDRLVGADRRAEDDTIGMAYGASQIVGDEVAKP